jgi:hypothetical protein
VYKRQRGLGDVYKRQTLGDNNDMLAELKAKMEKSEKK